MNSKLYLNGILISPEFAHLQNDKRIIELLNQLGLLNKVEKNQEFISISSIQFLIEECELEILSALNILHPFNMNNVKINVKSSTVVSPHTVEYFYKEKQIFLYNRLFFYTSDKRQKYLFINDSINELLSIIDDKDMKYEKKVARLLKLSQENNFAIEFPIKFDLIKNYGMELEKKDDNVNMHFLLTGVPNREINKIINSGFLYRDNIREKRSALVLDEDTCQDFRLLDKYRDKNISYEYVAKINSYNIEEFYEDLKHNFSENLFEKVSERFEKIIYTSKKFYPEIISSQLSYLVFLDEKAIYSVPVEKINDRLYNELKDEISKAISTNKKIIFFNNNWYDISEIIEAYKNKNNGKDNLTTQIIIKSNEVRIDFSEYLRKETSKKIDKQIDLSFLIKDLFNYQIEGIKKIIKAENLGYRGFLLADDMGLGKTLQTIMVIKYFLFKNKKYRVLIVCPLSLINNWEFEISKYCSELTNYLVQDLNKSQSYEKSIFITNYDSIIREKLYLKARYDLLIVDEVQRMKTYSTKTSRFIKSIFASFKIAISATPIENNIIEFWNIMDFLLPGFLGSKNQFKENYLMINENPCTDLAKEAADKLLKKIENVFLRREKSDLEGLSLPKKYTEYRQIYFTKEQTNAYISTYKTIDSDNVLPIVQILLQICDCPLHKVLYKSYKDYKILSAKINHLIEILLKIKEKNEKAIVFTRFIKTQLFIKDILAENNINSEIISGNVNLQKRSEKIEEFEKTNKYDVLIINPKVGGVGLNLVAANHVIHYTLEWNYAAVEQATDRAYRIGQIKDVYNYILYSSFPLYFNTQSKTVEEYLVELIKKKKAISNFLIRKFIEKNGMMDLENNLKKEIKIYGNI